jgi:hypothetical protein
MIPQMQMIFFDDLDYGVYLRPNDGCLPLNFGEIDEFHSQMQVVFLVFLMFGVI